MYGHSSTCQPGTPDGESGTPDGESGTPDGTPDSESGVVCDATS